MVGGRHGMVFGFLDIKHTTYGLGGFVHFASQQTKSGNHKYVL
jgi:hypothetical protein